MSNSINISDISKFLNNDFTSNDYIVDKVEVTGIEYDYDSCSENL